MNDAVFALIGACVGVIGAFVALDNRNRAIVRDKQKQLDEERERYATSKKAEYAAQRDFEHLKRNQEQLKEALRYITEDMERRQDKTSEKLYKIEALLSVHFKQMPELGKEE